MRVNFQRVLTLKNKTVFTGKLRKGSQRLYIQLNSKQFGTMNYLDEIKIKGQEANPFFVLMDINVVSFGHGKAELSMEVRPDMQNGVGWLQGGIYAALCDEAMALALYTVLDKDESIATISETTTYLQGVRKGRIKAKAQVTKKGRQVAFTEGYLTDDLGEKILSKTNASFAVIRK